MRQFLYSSQYSPGAPVLEIWLGAPGEKAEVGPFEALVDTGADWTVVPLDYLKRADAERASRALLRSQWGESRPVHLYAVAITVAQHEFSAPWVVGDELGDEIVLGRNILNRLRLLLDGPAAAVTVLDDAI